MIRIDALLSPAEQGLLADRSLAQTACVVFDVLRATTTLLEMLAQGAQGIRPVSEISEAVALRRADPNLLLAGERHGLRIHAGISGGIDFDFGNSPREVRRDRVEHRTVAMTTTNGTRALKACHGASAIWVAAFTNLDTTARSLIASGSKEILLVCSGTGADVAFEDVLGAGALADRLLSLNPSAQLGDAASTALATYRLHRHDLLKSLQSASNARRLLGIPDLAADVPACLELDRHAFAASMGSDGVVRRH